MKSIVIAPSILSAEFGRSRPLRRRDARGGSARCGQSGENAWRAADALVAGSAVFGSDDYAAAITRLRAHARPA
jgi:pentose-5-phosphate-3-epimerase